MNKKKIHMVTFLLLIVGGLNWGLEGIFQWGIGSFLPGGLATIIYILVGIAAVYELATHKDSCKTCNVDKSDAPAGGMTQ